MTEVPKDKLSFIKNPNVKDLLYDPENSAFKRLLIEAFSSLKKRGFLDVNKITEEINNIEDIEIDVEDFRATDTDFQTFMMSLSKLDAYRARVSDILAESQNDLDAIEMWYKDLRDIWISRSTGKSLDKREGESAEILSFLTPERITRKNLHNKVKMKFNSLCARIEVLSREITIGQELRKKTP